MLKKLNYKIISVLIAGILLISAMFVLITNNKSNLIRPQYKIQAEIDGIYLKGKLELKYINLNNFAVDDLYFCLYPNAFKNEENISNLVAGDMINQAYPNGFNEGYIKINSVTLNSNNAIFSLEENEQILKIDTPEIKSKKTAEITICFEEKLPNSPCRYGYGGNTYNFGNWYPILCPYENGVPIKSTYLANGDPFYSECADYTVDITMSNDFRLASTGIINSKNSVSPLNTKWNISANNVRDFAFIISSDYKLKSKQLGNTLVYSYYLSDDLAGQAALDYAVNALNCFNTMFGEYPYNTLSVTASDFYIGGMEYPNLVFIDKGLYLEQNTEALEEVIVHEVAHQWWYGVIGNNEIKEPWLDEGLTQYSVALYYEETYGKERYKMYLNESESYSQIVFEILDKANVKNNKKIERASNEFEHWLLYDVLVYDVSALMFDELRTTIGDKDFFNGLKHYYNDNKFSNVTKNNLISSFNKASKKNIEGILSPWLEGNIYWG